MPVTLDLTDDMDYFDNTETVSLYSLSASGETFTATTGIKALKEEGGFLYRNGIHQATRRYHLKVDDLSGAIPKEDDRIKDASNTYWVVMSVNLFTLGTRYQCECLQLMA